MSTVGRWDGEMGRWGGAGFAVDGFGSEDDDF
jgi:hypothetical protein